MSGYLGRLCVLGVVKLRRSRVCTVCAVCLSAQRSSLALYVLCRAMLESGRGFDWVSVSLHMLWRCYESKSAFVLCVRMSIVCCRVCRVQLACFVVCVCLPIVAFSIPRLRMSVSATAGVSNDNGLSGLGALRLRVWSSREFWCAFWLNEPSEANDIHFSGRRTGVGEWFRCCRGYWERIACFCVFHREQCGQDQSKLSHTISKCARIIHIFANNVP